MLYILHHNHVYHLLCILLYHFLSFVYAQICCDVIIFGIEEEPLFKGAIYDIPWTLVDYPIGRTDNSNEYPIFITLEKNEYGVSLPVITVNIKNVMRDGFEF